MAKRAATTNLNHNNWDREDEPEERGMFEKANDKVLQRRIIKTAKRHGAKLSSLKGSPFSGFAGFGTTNTSATSSPFSFLNQTTSQVDKGDEDSNSEKSSKKVENQTQSFTNSSLFSSLQKDNIGSNVKATSVIDKNIKLSDNSVKPLENILSKDDTGKESDKKSQNLEILKDLNLSCNSWITEHLEKNPYCILTPIFRDYEKHLAQLDLEAEVKKKEQTFQLPKPNVTNESSKPFIFSKENAEIAPNEEKEKTDIGSEISNKPTDSVGVMKFGGANNTFPFCTLFQSPIGSTVNLNVGNNVQSERDNEEDEETSETPKNEFTPVIEEDSIYDKRCKIYVKKDSGFVSKGVGTLFLKPVKNSKNTQLIVRADTSFGNILLNILLTSSLPVQKTGENNIMIVCIPTPESEPPPVPILVRVKTSEDCNEVIKKIEECKSSSV